MRLVIRWLLNAAALLVIAYGARQLGFLQGFVIADFTSAAIAAAVLALLSLTVKPIVQLLTLPITILTLGLFTVVINALMMMLTANFVSGFVIGGFLNAVIVSILFGLVSSLFNSILER
jgi:putative membrane protein